MVIISGNSEGKRVRFLALSSLIIAGETIFLLPFVLSRIFRPTFLDVFNITNFQLGTAFALYGIVAMFSYFAGGPLADRFSARRLIIAALIATSAGGVVMKVIPPIGLLTVLYGFWGLTTIFLFWGALIKTTRELGGLAQGSTFGLLDGGRGLFAAVISSVSVVMFAALLPEQVETATLEQRADALSSIITWFAGMGLLSAALVWAFIPEKQGISSKLGNTAGFNLGGLKQIMSMRTVWLQALIILCAYVAYKSTDDFSLLARDAFGYNDVDAARIGTISFWIRPFAAVAAGILADRWNAFAALSCCFVAVMVGSLVISSGWLAGGLGGFFLLTIAATSAGIYGLRGLYFAIFGEANVPSRLTGTAVGLVSFVGFTPDIFMGPVMGYLIDSSPGAAGHQHVFGVIFLFGFLGFMATYFFRRQHAALDARLSPVQE